MKSVFILGSQWQQSHTRAPWIDGHQSACLQLGCRVTQRSDELCADYLWTDILSSYLYNAGFFAVGCRKNSTEVQVVGQDDVVAGCGKSHDC